MWRQGRDGGDWTPVFPRDVFLRVFHNENARMVMATEDAKEGPRAFMEKRQPRYMGR